jgi:surface polysaccharide O-acyltransferase-like enzyme
MLSCYNAELLIPILFHHRVDLNYFAVEIKTNIVVTDSISLMKQTFPPEYENTTHPENSDTSPIIKNSARIMYADLLRIFATFFVIVVHFSSGKVDTIQVNDLTWEYFNCIHGLSRWCVPIFFMLSGMFFLNPQKQLSFKAIFCKYIFRILSALALWGSFYCLLNIYLSSLTGDTVFSFTQILQIPRYIILGIPYYHLWYLYAIIGLYLITPILRILVANMRRKHIEYCLFLFLIAGSLIPTINNYLAMINVAFKIHMGISELNGYSGLFLAGYYFSKYELTPRLKKSLYIIAIFLAIVSLMITSHLSILANKPDRFLYGYAAPNVIVAAFALFVAFKSFFTIIPFTRKLSFNIHYISSLTFGIFLIHPLFLRILSLSNIDAESFLPIISVPVLSGVVFILSAFCIGGLKKVPVFNKYFI